MSKVVVLQHVAHEGPGRIVPIFRDYGIPLDIRRLYQGDEVPTDLDEVRALIVLGGPMGVADVGNAKYPFLADEIAVLKRMITVDRPVLGICLGAQLLAAAGGAKVYPNVKMALPAKHGEPPRPAEPLTPLPEIGWAPVTFPFPGGTEPIVMGLHDNAMMLHWHFDTFDLPKLPPPPNPPAPPAPPPPTGNMLLSSTRICRNQAFRFKGRLFGFQYHVEIDVPGIEAMLQYAAEDVLKAHGPGGIKTIRDDTEKNYAGYKRMGDRVLNNFVQYLKLY